MVDKIEVVKRATVRRAKLYHIRDKAAKEVRRQCRMIARSAQDADDQAFVDSISWFNSDAAR